MPYLKLIMNSSALNFTEVLLAHIHFHPSIILHTDKLSHITWYQALPLFSMLHWKLGMDLGMRLDTRVHSWIFILRYNHIYIGMETKTTSKCPSNHQCHRGGAAKTWNIHFNWPTQKLDQKGGARPYPQQHPPVFQVLTGYMHAYRKSIGSPQTIHKNYTTSTRPKYSGASELSVCLLPR